MILFTSIFEFVDDIISHFSILAVDGMEHSVAPGIAQ